MKNVNKFLLLLVASIVLVGHNALHSKKKVISLRPVIKCFSSDSDIVQDALVAMKKSINNVEGNPYFVSCTYKITGKSPVEARTKVYFSNYHKRPQSSIRTFVGDPSIQVDRIVEVVYKTTEKGHVALIEKDPQASFKKVRECEIAVPEAYFA